MQQLFINITVNYIREFENTLHKLHIIVKKCYILDCQHFIFTIFPIFREIMQKV
jgi:hypothetical protein